MPLSPHQSPWIRALAEIFDGNVIGVFQTGLSQERISLGWKSPDYGKTQIYIAPDQKTVKQLIEDSPENSIHVFSSMVCNPLIHDYFKQVSVTKARIGILSEGRDWRGLKGVLRQVHSIFHERSYRRSVDFVLTIGTVGAKWYKRCGYDPIKLFPFSYVVEAPSDVNHKESSKSSVQVTAIGQLILRKRLDLLLNSLGKLSDLEWTLKVIGDGQIRPSLELMADQLKIKERVTFTGVLNNTDVRTELSQTDIFVLPSQWDGWGAVVNEALMSGVPVICSDYCGAAELIRPGINGDLFECGSIDSLAKVLRKYIAKGQLPEDGRQAIRNWAQCLDGMSVANYFMQILDSCTQPEIPRPMAPWKITNNSISGNT